MGPSRTHQLPRGTNDKRSQAVVRTPLLPEQSLEDGDEKGERLAATRTSSTEYILALERQG